MAFVESSGFTVCIVTIIVINSIGESMYSLFQIMTLENWSMGIVRPVMEIYPLASVFFVPFVIVTSFAVLNLFIALIVNSMQSTNRQDREAAEQAESTAHIEREEMLTEMRLLRAEVGALAKHYAIVDKERPR